MLHYPYTHIYIYIMLMPVMFVTKHTYTDIMHTYT